jgi:hypothetical protein
MTKSTRLLLLLLGISVSAFTQTKIEALDAKQHIGELVTVCGKIFSAKYLPNSTNQPTLLNLGGHFPNQLLTVAIFETDRKNFPFKPEEYYPNLQVCVTGKLVEYKGMPEIIVQSVDQIKLELDQATNTITPSKTNTKTVANAEGSYDITLSTDVNLRAGPGVDFASANILKAGSIVTILKSNNGWSFVAVKKAVGPTGNVPNGYIKNSVLK